ncbi:sodium/hydrogen exchanger 9B2-like isoform X1 [Babylonia areolata]|uniref:sodium/hydrogen exchanger 9B2-like isoform X1 n=1 Tax=Babylonia areolata TaxID=304850 RepID=UPI003FD15C0C
MSQPQPMSSKMENRNVKATDGDEVHIEYDIEQDASTAAETNKESTRCDRCQDHIIHCLKPVLHEYHPLPSHPNRCQRFKNSMYCPPHGRIGAFLLVLSVGFIWWGVLWAVVDKEALPGGNLFSLFLLFVFCWCGGYLISLVHLPPLLGMLIVGGILGNVPGIDIARNIDQEWSTGCRQIALAIILICAGLGLDPAALRRLSFVVVRLAFSPCIAETIADGVAAHLILGFPWQWGFMLGFVISAVSPAVVVPSLLSLSERGYGVEKGVPTLVMAASSIDDVLAITGFGVLIGITFSSGDLAWNLLKGPVEAIVGILVGIVMGVILWYVPQRKSKHLVLFRSVMVLGLSLLAIFGSNKVEWSGSGPLAALTLAFVAALRWRKELKEGEDNPVEGVMGVLWMIFQPLLFGLIAAAVEINKLEADTVGLGIAVLGIGLGVRCLVAFVAVFGTNLNMKEKLFIPFAWLPKATVQAAIGAVAYDMAITNKKDEYVGYGENILQLAVLSILLTAPTGAAIIAILGPTLLHCPPGTDELGRKGKTNVDDPEACAPLQEITGGDGDAVQNIVDGVSAMSLDRKKRNTMGDESEMKVANEEDSKV